MDPGFQEQQSRIHRQVAEELIHLIPETWKAVLLEVEARPDGLANVIKSPEGHRDIFAPTDAISSAIFRLQDLFASQGTRWRKVLYRLEEKAHGNWDFRVNFEYG